MHEFLCIKWYKPRNITVPFLKGCGILLSQQKFLDGSSVGLLLVRQTISLCSIPQHYLIHFWKTGKIKDQMIWGWFGVSVVSLRFLSGYSTWPHQVSVSPMLWVPVNGNPVDFWVPPLLQGIDLAWRCPYSLPMSISIHSHGHLATPLPAPILNPSIILFISPPIQFPPSTCLVWMFDASF